MVKKSSPKKKARQPKKEVIGLGKVGNIDPKLIMRAVLAVKKEREEAAKQKE